MVHISVKVTGQTKLLHLRRSNSQSNKMNSLLSNLSAVSVLHLTQIFVTTFFLDVVDFIQKNKKMLKEIMKVVEWKRLVLSFL